MGLKNTRPLPMATAELAMAPLFKKRFRSWHLGHVQLAMERYRLLTARHCVDAIQLGAIMGIKEQSFIEHVMRLFQPRTPTRVHHMVDTVEVVVAIILVCQAPSMRHRFEAIFDAIDLSRTGIISSADFTVLLQAVGRAMMKLFEYTIEPDPQDCMQYIQTILESPVGRSGKLEKAEVCKLLLSDPYAVHYTIQCTGDAKAKLYVMLEKESALLGAIEFHTEAEMKAASLQTVREMATEQLYRLPPEFTFLCQGREIKPVWEVDHKAWSIVPFALRGSPGLRTHAAARNRRLECPRHCGAFEFRYAGNPIPRYKKKVNEINPVYKHHGFKIGSKGGKPLESVVSWRVGENWSGEWVYQQTRVRSRRKEGIQKRLRTATVAKTQRVVVKNYRGELISPWSETNKDVTMTAAASGEKDSCEITVEKVISTTKSGDKCISGLSRSEQIRWKARIIAMDTLQKVDGMGLDRGDHAEDSIPDHDKENQHRPANIARSTTIPATGETIAPTMKSTTVLIHVEDNGKSLPSRLLQLPQATKAAAIASTNEILPLSVNVLPFKLALNALPSHGNGTMSLGQFQSSSNLRLEEDEVEVFPVLVIRPSGAVLELDVSDGGQSQLASDFDATTDPSDTGITASSPRDIPLVKFTPVVNPAFISEFEFRIGPTESSFEYVHHHVFGVMQDAINLNRVDVLGRTMLHDAAEFGHSNLMDLLLEQRVLLNEPDSRGDTPLHHAARRGNLKEVSALLRQRAAPWNLNFEGKSPLYCALETAAKVLRRTRESHLVPPSTSSSSADTIFRYNKNFFTTTRNYPKLRQVIDLLWDRYPMSMLTKKDIFERRHCLALEKQVYGDLFQACRDGDLPRVQRLMDIEKRPIAQYVNENLSCLRLTALHEAAEQGHTAIVDLLLKVGANGYLTDQRSQTPLHAAAAKGHARIVDCLAHKFPGSLPLSNCVGKTALHLAIACGHESVALALIAAILRLKHDTNDTSVSVGDILNAQDLGGYTALHYACDRGALAICRALVQSGEVIVSISLGEYRIPSQCKHLLGVHWKRLASGTPSTAASSTNKKRGGKSVFAQVRTRATDSCDAVTSFEILTPIEVLLIRCKSQPREYTRFVEIMKILVVAWRRERQLRNRAAQPQKLAMRLVPPPPPLYHLASSIASVNTSVAVAVCIALHEVQFEINTTHSVTGDTVLLQECKRVCGTSTMMNRDDTSTPLAVVRMLVQLGANVNLPNPRTGETPLACAAWHGHPVLLGLLLEVGAEVNVYNHPKPTSPFCDPLPNRSSSAQCSFSALHFAALGGSLPCAEQLLHSGAEVNVAVHMPTVKGASAAAESVLCFAVRARSEEMVNLLLKHGADACALSTVHNRIETAFAIHLRMPQTDSSGSNRPTTATQARALAQRSSAGPGHAILQDDDTNVPVVSPLTFTLLTARASRAFAWSSFASDTNDNDGAMGEDAAGNGLPRWRGRRDRERFHRIALAITARAVAAVTPSGSAGSSLITRQDISLACQLGYWELAATLVSHFQGVLPSARSSAVRTALHLAAAAGQTKLVTALCAAGMNVNCVYSPIKSATGQDSSWLSDQRPRVRTKQQQKQKLPRTHHLSTVVHCVGALYFALINGHTDTAARLLVLGAMPLDTLPHLVLRPLAAQKASTTGPEAEIATTTTTMNEQVQFLVREHLTRRARDEFFQLDRSRRAPSMEEERIAIHFVVHLQLSINQNVPLLHYAAAMGYTSSVRRLIDAGTNILQPPYTSASPQSAHKGPDWRHADTAIHAAIQCRHLETVALFAGMAQHNFPSFFQRDGGHKSESLLVTASRAKCLPILQYLLKTTEDAAASQTDTAASFDHGDGSGGCGGGYNSRDTPEDLTSALNACAATHFVEGFTFLLARGASRPDLFTLVQVLQHVERTEQDTENEAEALRHHATARPRHDHRARPLGPVVALLHAIVPFAADHVDTFFSTLSFDHVLLVFILCAQHQWWFVLEAIFVRHSGLAAACPTLATTSTKGEGGVGGAGSVSFSFLSPLNPWRAVLVRAASCCLLLHRAAIANEVKLVRFLLELGVPVDLRLSTVPRAMTPVWYAATHGALDTFLMLALHSPDLFAALALEKKDKRAAFNSFRIYFRSITHSTSWVVPSARCRWQNLAVMSCFSIPRAQTNAMRIQKFINMCIAAKARSSAASSFSFLSSSSPSPSSSASPLGASTLLHAASAVGEVLSVQTLLAAGAQVTAMDMDQRTPLMVAACRRDTFGTLIVRLLVSALVEAHQRVIDPAEQKQSALRMKAHLSRALVSCFTPCPSFQPTQQLRNQKRPCTSRDDSVAICNLATARVLLAAGAGANTSFQDAALTIPVASDGPHSAMAHALRAMHLAGVQCLLAHGGTLSIALIERFLHCFPPYYSSVPRTDTPEQDGIINPPPARLLKKRGERLEDVSSLMLLVLDALHATTTPAIHADALHHLVAIACELAATKAKWVGKEQAFWKLVVLALERHPEAIASRQTEWHRPRASALHSAVQAMEVRIVRLLLDTANGDVDAEDIQRRTPLHLVARNGDVDICRLLLMHMRRQRPPARVDALDRYGRTALHVAVIYGHEAIVTLLLAQGASLTACSTLGFNAALYAAKLNQQAILMALYARDSSRGLLFSADGEFALFVAAQHGAFRVVRWLMTIYDDGGILTGQAQATATASQEMTAPELPSIYTLTCRTHHRSLLHYAAMHGDDDLVRTLVRGAGSGHALALINRADALGYTPLLYAFALGRLAVVEILCNHGADASIVVSHASSPPPPQSLPALAAVPTITTGFSIESLSEWFALPGWFTFVGMQYPSTEKKMRRLGPVPTTATAASATATAGDGLKDEPNLNQEWDVYLRTSGYRRRRERCGLRISRTTRLPVRGARFPQLVTHEKKRVATTMRSWRFPHMSLLDFACDVGDENVVTLVARLHELPGLLERPHRSPAATAAGASYTRQRINFMQAVRWNRIETVERLLALAQPPTEKSTPKAAVAPPRYDEFLEAGIDCAVSRGLETMTIMLLSHWKGIQVNPRTGDAMAMATTVKTTNADAEPAIVTSTSTTDQVDARRAAFAFQFAPVFQVACIRGMRKLVLYMIERGGDQLLNFQWNEGSALLYAFAFGHRELVTLLQSHRHDRIQELMIPEPWMTPSVKTWMQLGCPPDVHVAWYEQQPNQAVAQDDCAADGLHESVGKGNAVGDTVDGKANAEEEGILKGGTVVVTADAVEEFAGAVVLSSAAQPARQRRKTFYGPLEPYPPPPPERLSDEALGCMFLPASDRGDLPIAN